MSRRIAAPILLLLAAVLSIAAVFAVHGIEDGNGPLSEPYATRFFAPGTGTATIRFATHDTERVTIRIVDSQQRVVRTLRRDVRIHGPHTQDWDGRDDDGSFVAEGDYEVQITRAGDSRVYSPTRPIQVDTTPPAAMLDLAVVADGKLRGHATVETGTKIRVEDADGDPIGGLRAWQPPASDPAHDDLPDGSIRLRFSVAIDPRLPIEPLRIIAFDRSGNETDLLANGDVSEIEVLRD